MSKNSGFGKFLLFCAAVFAAFAGVYYYLSKRDAAIADDFDDDDFEDFEDYEDEEPVTESKFGSRKYVNIKTNNDSSDEEPESEPSKSEEFFDDEK
jgi:hypothetical protein